MNDTLPKALDSERYIIGCFRQFPDDAGKIFELLSPNDFFDIDHKKIFRAASKQFMAGGIDYAILGSETGCSDILFDCGNFHNAPSTAALIPIEAAKIVECRKKRQFHAIADDARRAALNGHSVDDAIRSFTADLEDMQRDSTDTIELTCAADVEPRSVDWAWHGYLPRGMFVMFDGDPEKGKSQITCDITACWTKPKSFPFVFGDDFREPGNVLMIASEDANDTTIRPRLDAAGANPKRVFLWPEEVEPISLPSGIDRLTEAVKRYEAGLLILDPITAYLDDTINSNRDADVRRALRPLIAMAQETNTTVIGVRHLNKDSSKDPLYRGGGSVAFTAAARVVWAAGEDPSDPTKRIFMVLKSNIGPKPTSLTYSIEGSGISSRIKWEGASTHTARDVLTRQHGRQPTKCEQAKDMWLELLDNGPRPVIECESMFEKAGIGKSSVKQARAELGIQRRKSSLDGGWIVYLPEEVGPEEVGQDF